MPILKNARHERFTNELCRGCTVTEAAQKTEFEVPLCGKHVGFYVYALIDPRSDKPFYIGKGKNRRYAQHAANFKSGREKNSDKARVIASILKDGLQIITICLGDGLGESQAYAFEADVIRAIGAKNLTNFGSARPQWEVDVIAALKAYARIMPLTRWIYLEWLETKKQPDEWRIQMFKRVKAELLAIAAYAWNLAHPNDRLKVRVPDSLLPSGKIQPGYVVS